MNKRIKPSWAYSVPQLLMDRTTLAAYIRKYNALLLRAVAACEDLMALYEPDAQAGNVYAANCATEAATRRQVTLNFRAPSWSMLSVATTSVFIVSMAHYLDTHWADYGLYPSGNAEGAGHPTYDPKKRQTLERLHAELEAVMNGIGEISNALRDSSTTAP